MTINSNTQSFTSLNGAIKVTKIDNTDSSSKKLSDAVSVNISSNATSNTTSLLNSLKEETVIQSNNGYVNLEQEAALKKMREHYLNAAKENNKFANPYDHLDEKYNNPTSPYYIQGLSKEERNAAYTNELFFQRNQSYYNQTENTDANYMLLDDPFFKSLGPVSGGIIETAERKAFDREKVNTQFQSLLNKYNVTIPQDTKLSFTIDPNTLKATVSGTDDETLTKSVEDVINTADNATELFYHISSSVSDDSTQYTPRQYSKFNLTKQIKDVTGYSLKDLEIKDGKFMTPDGIDVAEIYTKKINENPKMSDYYKMMSIGSNVADLKKLAKDGFDSVPDLVLSIDYQNGSFYDVKQSENFGTEKSGWIKDWKESLFNKIKSQGYDSMTESDYLDTTQFTEKYNDIDLTSKKNSTNSDNKEVLTKDELMLKYLLDNLEEQKRVKIKEGNSLE
ncbi:DUF4885 domain-containing protein [Aliarcobacter cryaerophilus]|uniref:DUF4885 domain-containing protein n=1 Tax=Aliarcobacter cryaerophilus TaxID=28198 RepID=UPI0021B55A16|nr:DUF4885 domain-containing protein [Aliarcobacter cryaerophilus]MCT7467063.1 DUF4885 domain-containing protein [Aliarcobacter cryaerophilus]